MTSTFVIITFRSGEAVSGQLINYIITRLIDILIVVGVNSFVKSLIRVVFKKKYRRNEFRTQVRVPIIIIVGTCNYNNMTR